MSEYKPSRPNSIGGQALIEGVMMRGKQSIAIAVRKPDGIIELKEEKPLVMEKWRISKWPIFRGLFALVSSMIIGVNALTYSAEFFIEDPEAEKSRLERFLEAKLGKHADNVIMAFSIVFALGFAMLLFGIIPTVLVGFLKTFVASAVALSAIEGVLKIGMFIAYVSIISQMNDIKRVFQYHGAEHKTIHCYESGQDVTVENAQKFPTLHPRCGTSFVFFVLIISIVLFTFISWESLVMRMAMKLLLLPLVAGISYEMIKIAGKSNHAFVRALSFPGLMMQKLTTREPDDAQVEVAIAAFMKVLEIEGTQ